MISTELTIIWERLALATISIAEAVAMDDFDRERKERILAAATACKQTHADLIHILTQREEL